MFCKPPPFTVRVNAGAPAVTEVGLRESAFADSAVTVKVRALEAGAPGLTTVMEAEPGRAIKELGICMESWLAVKRVVESGAPFHWAVQPLAKPEPLTWMPMVDVPWVTLAGTSEVRVALLGAAEVIVNAKVLLLG